MSSPKKAIAVYLDNSDKMQKELSWIYKTWIFNSLEDEYDLVVFYNPEAKERLISFKGIKAFEMPPVRMAKEYGFLNSHYFCLPNYRAPLQKYDHLFKTDCDVFLTKNMKNFTPHKFMVGEGCFYDQRDTKKINFIKKISSELGLGYNNMPNIGASFYGKTNQVLSIVSSQVFITEHLLKNYFKDTAVNEESGFRRGVASMIAGEVSVNNAFNSTHVNLYSLDTFCSDNPISSETLHIHAWHTNNWWSKHDFFKNKYSDVKVEFKDAFKSTGNYCHWIASSSLEEIMEYKILIKNI